jgi:hypothetical protein
MVVAMRHIENKLAYGCFISSPAEQPTNAIVDQSAAFHLKGLLKMQQR